MCVFERWGGCCVSHSVCILCLSHFWCSGVQIHWKLWKRSHTPVVCHTVHCLITWYREKAWESFWELCFLLIRWNTDVCVCVCLYVCMCVCVFYETNTPAPTDGDSLRWINGWSNHKQLRNTTLYFRIKTAATHNITTRTKKKAAYKQTIKFRQAQRTNLTVAFQITGCAVMTTKTQEH